MRILLSIAILLGTVSVIHGQSPGGVSGNLIWWVKANAEAYTNNGTTLASNGQTVRRWDNQAAATNNAVNTDDDTKPIYRTNIINSNPALQFDGTKFLDSEANSGIGDTESFYMFLVFKQNSYQTNGGTQDGDGTFIIDRPTATNNLTSFKIVDTDKYLYQRRENDNSDLGGPVSPTSVNTTSFVIIDYYRNRISGSNFREGIYLDGDLEIDQAGPTGNILGPPIRIGRHATNTLGGLNGYFAEMIIYNTNLTTANRQRVESYLAIKYGITLGATVNYVRSNGSVIYPSTTTHAAFVNDIAGIGLDNNSALNQTTSKSQNANSVLTISGATDLENNEFFVVGSNGGSLITPNTSDVDGGTIKRRLSRVWRVAETGAMGTDGVGNITLEFDLSDVPGSKSAASLRLLIDRDGDGFADNDRTPLSGTYAGNTFSITVSNANLINGDRFTIGTTNISTTPLPIELTDFNVTYENPVVVASWQTASELNNDFFTLERAGDDLSFEELGTKPGAGTSKIPHNYSMIDSSPYEGRSYYRLKQTDFDGTVSYSDTKHMFIEETEKKLSIYPNPNDGKNFKVSWGTARFNLNHLEVINQQGKSVESFYFDDQDLREYSHELKHRLSPGLYMVRIHYNGKDEFVKLMVQP